MITFRLPRLKIRLFHPNKVLILLWLFLLVFPKGGFKIAGIPLTWGYLSLGLLPAFFFLRKSYSCQVDRIYAFLLTIPFQIVSFMSLFLNGIDHISFGISFIISFFFLPWLFFIYLSNSIETMNLDLFFKLFKKGIFFISAYGIFLFFFKLYTGKFLEIPFLTINFHDLGEMKNKHNNRGYVFKLISTYNNGNIYGICLLMLLPFYQYIERSIWRKSVVIISLILTLSRTVWIGMLFSTMLSVVIVSRKFFFLKLILFISLSCSAIFVLAFYFGWGSSFFFDPELGGRIEQIRVFETASLFPDKPLFGIQEMVYLWILSNFGILGLIAYLMCMASPFILAILRKSLSANQKSILCGLANFLFVSLSDGALLFIPVLAFYWILSSIALRNSLESQATFGCSKEQTKNNPRCNPLLQTDFPIHQHEESSLLSDSKHTSTLFLDRLEKRPP